MPARTWRSPLRLLQIGSIVLPAAIIAIWGAVSWNSHKDAAFAQARSNVEVLREYALRVFETQQSLLFEAERLIEGVDVTQIEQREVHELLRPLIGRLRFTLGVGVISPDGDILAPPPTRSPAAPIIAPISRSCAPSPSSPMRFSLSG
jgi:hypothetical protein